MRLYLALSLLEQGYKIHAMEIVADHVHLFLEFHPSTSLSKVLQYLKGGSSHRLFKLHPELKKRYWGGSLWSSGKFFRSVGNVTADTIEHYIKESQGNRKQSSNGADQGDPGNEDSTISGFHKTGREGVRPRSIPHPLGWGGRTQFDFKPDSY